MGDMMNRMRRSFSVLTEKEAPLSLEATISVVERQYKLSLRDSKDSILTPIRNRIAMDVAAVKICHVNVDEKDSFLSVRKSELNNRLLIQANLDQSGTAFIQEAASTMLEHGVCALVPVETSVNPAISPTYDILSFRVGTITHWYNRSVEVEVYNIDRAMRVKKMFAKDRVAIVPNPMYAVMNEHNGTMQRLINKHALLDMVDNKNNSGVNLDVILQLPFPIRGEQLTQEAELRMKSLTEQLNKSQYGIGYIGATDKITQLNRPVVNNLREQIEALQTELYSQLGMSQAIFLGNPTPDEWTLYTNRTVTPILKAITDSLKMTFLTKTALSQGQSIMWFHDLFKMVPVNVLAEITATLTGAAVVSSDEMRPHFGYQPVGTPESTALSNKNINTVDNSTKGEGGVNATTDEESPEPGL